MMETSSVMKRLLLTMVAAAAAAATAATVAAATAAPGCCAPAKWEGEYQSTFLLHDNSAGSVTVTEDVYKAYDSLNERFVVITNTTQKALTERIVNLQLYRDHVSYRYNVGTGKCTAGSLSAVYSGYCVPAVAQVIDPSVSVSLGSGPVEASLLNYKYQNSFATTLGLVYVQKNNCIPLSYTVGLSSSTGSNLYHDRALKVAEGITSMAVFDIPAACKNIVPSFGPKATIEDDLTRGLL